jgi:DNA-binding winged helix-turn-helix (wHTH) protein
MGDEPEYSVAFGPFRLCPKQRLLLEKDKHLRLGSRALDILITLVERSGELVSKQELNARVWPGMIVEDSNLKVHVAALRRTLGDGKDGNRYICTVTGRGYCFVAPVVRSSSLTPNEAHQAWHVSPATMKAVANRDLFRKLAAQLPPQHFIAVIGIVTQLDRERRR